MEISCEEVEGHPDSSRRGRKQREDVNRWLAQVPLHPKALKVTFPTYSEARKTLNVLCGRRTRGLGSGIKFVLQGKVIFLWKEG